MTKAFRIDNPQASVTIAPGAQLRHAHKHVAPPAGFSPVVRTAADVGRALTASRQQLSAALRRNDALQAQALLHRHQLTLLEQAVAQARKFAHHDELTGLPNRRLLVDRYDQAVALAARQHRRVGLLFLDLDGFKSINDTHGHPTGDRILQQVATRLRACVRSSDTVCRYGGDEFVILLPELEGPNQAVAAAMKIRARLAAPYVVDGTRIAATASIGMAVYPDDGREYGALMHVTDASMYRDKASVAACPDYAGSWCRPGIRTAGSIRQPSYATTTSDG